MSAEKRFWPHLAVLSICGAILAGLWLLTPPSYPEGSLKLMGISLPPVCSFNRLTGLSCPGCGLTRSLTEVLHGNLSRSMTYHSLGWITLLYMGLQITYRASWLILPQIREFLERVGFYLNRTLIYLAVLFALNWIKTLFF